jgi:hypothetical protein
MNFIGAHKKALVICTTLCLLVGGGVLWLHELSKPTSAKVFTTVGSTAPTPVSQTATLTPVHNPYANFSYPNTLSPLAGMDGPHGEEVALYNYGKQDVVPWHLAITINHLQQPSLNSDSGYMVRKDRPSQYQATTITSGSNTFIVMTDTQAGGFGKAAFILHGDLSADISLTGDDSLGGSTLAQVFLQILQSWEWQ